MRLTWLGHSSVLLETGGLRIVADPLLRDQIGPLRRIAPLPPVAADLRADVVLISHLHHDHCDLPSLRRLAAPLVVGPPGSGAWLAAQGVPNATDLDTRLRLRLGPGVSVVAVHARHHGRREPRGPSARSVGHLVYGPDGVAWLAGDTGLYAGMTSLPRATEHDRIDLAAIPVWGWGPKLGPGHLDPAQAATAVVLAKVRVAVPVHWGTLHPIGFRTAMRDRLRAPGPEFAAHARDTGVTARVLAIGASTEV